MPPDNFPGKAKEHVKESWRDFCLYERLIEQEPSWATVLLFYSLMHLVQAHAVRKKTVEQSLKLPKDHQQRKQYIVDNLGNIVGDYREVQAASEDVRYDLIRLSTEKVKRLQSQAFSRAIEDLSGKGVSWQKRLTVEERATIFSDIALDAPAPSTNSSE